MAQGIRFTVHGRWSSPTRTGRCPASQRHPTDVGASQGDRTDAGAASRAVGSLLAEGVGSLSGLSGLAVAGAAARTGPADPGAGVESPIEPPREPVTGPREHPRQTSTSVGWRIQATYVDHELAVDIERADESDQ